MVGKDEEDEEDEEEDEEAFLFLLPVGVGPLMMGCWSFRICGSSLLLALINQLLIWFKVKSVLSLRSAFSASVG